VFQVAAPTTTDSVELTVMIDDSDCVPGECVCRGTAERSSGLWRVGLDAPQLSAGIHCVVADFDGNGHVDFAMLGGEGMLGVAMYGVGGATAGVEVDAAGYPGLYQPREAQGPNGEPPSNVYGIFVPNVGRNHAVFPWVGDTFVRSLYPAP
jgi:hypothetical protein